MVVDARKDSELGVGHAVVVEANKEGGLQKHKKDEKRGHTFRKIGEILRSGNCAVILDVTILLDMVSSSNDRIVEVGPRTEVHVEKVCITRLRKETQNRGLIEAFLLNKTCRVSV